MVIERIAELRAFIDADWHELAVPSGMTLTMQEPGSSRYHRGKAPEQTGIFTLSGAVAIPHGAVPGATYDIEVVTASGVRWRVPARFTIVFGARPSLAAVGAPERRA